ncbi:MAG TPA: hypothetical protein VED40_23345 [Azospirillaceae bacterium]|nr:hypothetical protein [Azospirillaceae bacterium]
MTDSHEVTSALASSQQNKTASDIATTYRAIAKCYEGREAARVDVQTEFAEMLALVQAVHGTKPSFMAFASSRSRQDIVGELDGVCRKLGVPSGFSTGPVDHRHRALNIADPQLAPILEAQMSPECTVFWASRDPYLIDLYDCGRMAEVSEARRLGYPPCCASWHYDWFHAREVEASVKVYQADGGLSEDDIRHLREDWVRGPGFFFPREVMSFGVHRSNADYPFVAFIACPACLGSRSSQTAFLNELASALGMELDPRRHAEVLKWADDVRRELPEQASMARRAIVAESDRLTRTTRGRDEYCRQGKYMLKALGSPH